MNFKTIVKTTVKEVQVYRVGATVIRYGEAELAAGRNILVIGGMTETADSGSFKLKFPEKVRAVNLQVVNPEDMQDKGEIQKESEAVKKQLDDIDYQIGTCELMLELRKKNSDFSGRQNITTEEQEKMLEALPEQLLSLHRKIDQLNEEKKKLEKALEKAEKEEKKPVILAELVAAEGGTVPFILQYQEMAAVWKPKYEIQYFDDKSPLEVRMKAEIVQRSGEDWKQVKVTLFTGNPSVSNDLPVMSTLMLSLYEPQKNRVRAKGMMMGAACGAMADGAMVCEEVCEDGAAPEADMIMADLMMESAEMSEEETMKSFLLPNARDILSDTDGNRADLQSFTVKANYHVLAIPSVDTRSFLTAEIAAAQWPLPPANAAIYLRDAFAGEVYVDPTRDTDLLTLSLGQDERLTIVRTEKPKQTQDVFLKGVRRESHCTEIRILNTSSDTVKALIKDQIPVSTDKNIEIETSNLSEGILDAESGEVRWEIMAEPEKPVELALEYRISWPKDKRLEERRKAMKVKTRFCPGCGSIVTGKFCPECGKEV